MNILRKLLFIPVIILLYVNIYASIGPYKIHGQPSTNLFLINENTPIVILSEAITIDYTGPPVENIVDQIYLNGSIVSTYELLNDSDIEQTVQMAIAYVGSLASMERIRIQVNGKDTPFTPYFGEVFKGYTHIGQVIPEAKYNYTAIADSIRNGLYEPKNFSCDEVGVLYTFDVASDIDRILFDVELDYNPENSKVFVNEGFHWWEYGNKGRQSSYVYKTCTLSMFVLGEQFDFKYNAYTDNTRNTEVEAYTCNVTNEKQSIYEFLYTIAHSSSYKIPNKELYVTYSTQALDEAFTIYNGFGTLNELIPYSEKRISACGFFVTFPPDSKKKIVIKQDTFASMNRKHTRNQYTPVFSEKFLFNTLNNWASIGNVSINIILHDKAPFIVYSNLKFEKNEYNTYHATFDGLPTKNLIFFMHAEKWVRIKFIYLFGVLFAIMFFLFFRCRMRRRNRQ